jgi:NAD(P)-dependent dehydrogenase (short-subunit alcohol dehydrogenase family)
MSRTDFTGDYTPPRTNPRSLSSERSGRIIVQFLKFAGRRRDNALSLGGLGAGNGRADSRDACQLLASHSRTAWVLFGSCLRPPRACFCSSSRRPRAQGIPSIPKRTASALVDECIGTFGRLDALINCAGIAEPPGSSILNISPQEFDRLISAHLGTAFHTCRVAARVMASQGHGSIVNTGSVAFLGDYGGTGYPAGKGAVNAMTMAIAAELKAYGVRANVVCPGARTRLSTGADYEKHIDDLYQRGLLDEMTMRASLDSAPAAFVAPLYAYLASDLSRDVTGRILVASGGFVGSFDRPAPDLHQMLGLPAAK